MLLGAAGVLMLVLRRRSRLGADAFDADDTDEAIDDATDDADTHTDATHLAAPERRDIDPVPAAVTPARSATVPVAARS